MSSPYGGDQSGFAAPHAGDPSGQNSATPAYGAPNAGYGGNPYGNSEPSYENYGQTPGYATAPVPYQNPYQNPYRVGAMGYVQPPASGMAIASLVLSLCGLVTGITAPVGLILGIVARNQIKNDPQRYGGAGMALGGIIAGAIITALGALVVVAYIALFAWMFSYGY